MGTLTKDNLQQFTGDLQRYRHPLNRKVIYTPGVQYVAEEGEAYWLIDAIASWIGSEEFNDAVSKDYRIGEMHFWTLETSWSNAGQLTARADSPEKPFVIQNIELTDFPLRRIDIWAAFDGEYWTLHLPSEH
tara:strand:- start:23847 stop:24242 length:396 start_codon:yes stop_codon:yes gene_type:complete